MNFLKKNNKHRFFFHYIILKKTMRRIDLYNVTLKAGLNGVSKKSSFRCP